MNTAITIVLSLIALGLLVLHILEQEAKIAIPDPEDKQD